MSILVILIHTLYVTCVIGLALYGFQALWLTWHYLRRETGKNRPEEPHTDWPSVSVHLPIYNEQHVAERIINACAQLSYPTDKLTIRVLDDSNDSTTAIAHRAVQDIRDCGIRAEVVRRENRTGYKAGALAYALEDESADFIAIFDADFLPQGDFLLRTMPRFYDPGNERVGFVQTRWGHLNREDSLLTRSQAVALDGHFVVEQSGRQAAGFAFGFNGSGGVWRRACIEDPAVGGWQADTLCEDLDLSYRAQLGGWQGLYLNDVESPAEIPPQLLAFKRQQFRWAQGSVQTLRKLGKSVWSSDWSAQKRFAATLHLGAYLLHPMLLCLLLISLPLVLFDAAPAAPLAVLSLLSIGPPLLYGIGQRRLYGREWSRNMLVLPILMLLGTGLSLSNSVAAMKGLFGGKAEFMRTPKFNTTEERNQWQGSAYRLRLQPILIAEILLALYALGTAYASASRGKYFTMAFVMLYVFGFGLVAGLGIWQEWTARASLRQERKRDRANQNAGSELQPASSSREN